MVEAVSLVDGLLGDHLLHHGELGALALRPPHLEPNPTTVGSSRSSRHTAAAAAARVRWARARKGLRFASLRGRKAATGGPGCHRRSCWALVFCWAFSAGPVRAQQDVLLGR